MNQSAKRKHLEGAVSHINDARRLKRKNASAVSIANSYFHALNKIQTSIPRALAGDGRPVGEVRAFQNMILDCLKDRPDKMSDECISHLAGLNPMILSHKVLNDELYEPALPIKEDLIKKASSVHRKFRCRLNNFLENEADVSSTSVANTLAELLYIVRSNIAHGEKTPRGPDLNKNKRDNAVCEVVIPTQELLIDLLLAFPSQRLASYGTLSPGEVNHCIVGGIPGKWKDCLLLGQIREEEGLKIYKWDTYGDEIAAKILSSPDLPKRWGEIDRFEGARYGRGLTLACVDDQWIVANVYMGNDLSDG